MCFERKIFIIPFRSSQNVIYQIKYRFYVVFILDNAVACIARLSLPFSANELFNMSISEFIYARQAHGTDVKVFRLAVACSSFCFWHHQIYSLHILYVCQLFIHSAPTDIQIETDSCGIFQMLFGFTHELHVVFSVVDFMCGSKSITARNDEVVTAKNELEKY